MTTLERKCTALEPDQDCRIHPDAVVIRHADDTAFSGGNKTRYRCPNCALEFEVTEADY